eukprot:CAMPEP_0174916360 /NCGR_PEP_ID=MMETSP1355-20121228/1779_1 /TAXON_ID=464990 /ORGANISM="Hemiselmis tepida, Strain CCMP443" /LENGTH=208 /DNA_ID=CAMNT_0016161361 /DNA_START=29 /DNA_END=652 /DNA_ORIENTATION=-
MSVKVCTHPLMKHKLAHLRDKSVQPKEFRELSTEISTLLAYEAMADLPTAESTVATPFAESCKTEIVSSDIGVVPIMRSGLGMVDGFIYAYPLAQVWHVGLYRDTKTLVPVEYYNRFSLETSLNMVYVLDSTLNCGAVDKSAVGLVKEWGVQKIKLCVIVASPEGIKAFHEEHPDVDIVTGSIDEGLTEGSDVYPGLGDPGNRFFGTV